MRRIVRWPGAGRQRAEALVRARAGACAGRCDLRRAHARRPERPDGFKADAPMIIEALELAGPRARGVIFPFHEPAGYREANEAVIADAAASGGRIVCFCRLDPRQPDAVQEAERCLDAG